MQGWGPHPRKQCTLKRQHNAHSWWSRKQQCYYQCVGIHR